MELVPSELSLEGREGIQADVTAQAKACKLETTGVFKAGAFRAV